MPLQGVEQRKVVRARKYFGGIPLRGVAADGDT